MKKTKEEILYFGQPIKLTDKVSMYQPTLKEIIESGYSLEELIEPFITLDKQNFKEDKDNSELNNFDIFFLQILMGYISVLKNNENVELGDWLNSPLSNGLVIKRLIRVFKFLFRTEDVDLYISKGIADDMNENYIMINKSYKIDRSNYEEVKWMVCDIFDTDMKIEKKPQMSKEEKTMNDLFEQKKKAYKEAYGREAREGNDKKMTIFTLVDYIVNNKYSQYNYNTVQDLTIYQIKNTFRYYQRQEAYDIEVRYRTSGNFKMDKKSEHWFFDK